MGLLAADKFKPTLFVGLGGNGGKIVNLMAARLKRHPHWERISSLTHFLVIDTNKEALAIKEANRLKIPVIAILDTNSDPQGITYPVPGNDDAARALQLYCDLMADAILDGLTEGQAMSLAVNGFINDLARQFPMEYSVELKRLIDLEMEGSVG